MLDAILALPALAAGLSLLPWGRRFAATATVVSSLLVLLLASYVAMEVRAGAPAYAAGGWLTCDGLAAFTLWLVSFVGLAASLFSWGEIQQRTGGPTERAIHRYYAGHNLFLLSILAIPMLQNVAMVWTAAALTTLLSAFLVSFEGTPEALEAAWKYVVLTSLGATVALFGVVLLYWASSTAGLSGFSWSELVQGAPRLSAPLLLTAFVFVLVGFGTKVGLVPLHTWLPETYSQAPLPICAMMSGAEATAVLYVILRLLPVLAGAGVAANGWLIGFGLLSAAVAALLMLQAHDLKRLFAFSTIEHMGIILVAAGLGSSAGNMGAVYELLAHSLAKSLCFFAAGLAIVAAGTSRIDSIRGLIRSSPVAGAALMVAGLAICGLPPFAVFIGELAIIGAGLQASHYLVIGLLTLFIVMAFFGVMARVNRMVFGEPEADAVRRPLPAGSVVAAVVVLVPLVVLGLYVPQPVRTLMQMAAQGLGGN